MIDNSYNVKITIGIIMCISQFGLAQEFEWLANSPDSKFLGIYEVDGKYIGAVSNGLTTEYDPNTIYQLSLYDVTFNQTQGEGLKLNELVSIPFMDDYATINLDYIKETETWLIVQSKFISSDKHSFRGLLCNKNFEVLSSQTIDTTGEPGPCFFDSYQGKTYILESIIGPPHKMLFLEYYHSSPMILPPIQIKETEPQNMFAVTSMQIDHRTNDMLVFYYNGIAELNTNLHQDLRLGYDEIHTAYHGTVIGTNTNYFSHSLIDQDSVNYLKSLAFQKYDTLFNILNSDTLGIKGVDYYPFIIKSMDYKNNEFLIGGHVGPFPNLNFNKCVKKFYLAKYDEFINQIWYKEFGGDRAYVLTGLQLLDEGECIAYGYITDNIENIWHAYIIYLNADGEILTTSTTSPNSEYTFQVVNPGNEILQIKNPNGIRARIEVLDIQGHVVVGIELKDELTVINTSGLPVGLYPYRIIQNGKVISFGKCIKEK